MGEAEAKGFTAAALAPSDVFLCASVSVVNRLALPEISNNRQNYLANFTAINKSQSRCSNNHADTERIEELHNDVSIGQSHRNDESKASLTKRF